jgi:small ubiquitin-related modifier
MNAYCDRQSVEFNSIAFLFDGRRLRGEQTPDEVSLSMLVHARSRTCIDK